MPGRVVRAGLFSGVSTGLAVTGHHLASGHAASWTAGLPGGVLLFLGALRIVGRPAELPATMAATAGAQALLHFWFNWADGPAAHHAHHAHASHGSDAVWHAGHHGMSMSVAHLVAALLVAWLMQRADVAVRGAVTAAAHRLADAVTELLVRLLSPRRFLPAAPADRHVRPRTRSRAYPSVVLLAHVVVRRGPPVGRLVTV
ncbi:hypothetical protein SAMN05428939_1330 [Streptomyces sp. TLI_105]|nr:hypothetical protein SAMN05428939_1330 [Streptomyces sp. TLI_105]